MELGPPFRSLGTETSEQGKTLAHAISMPNQSNEGVPKQGSAVLLDYEIYTSDILEEKDGD